MANSVALKTGAVGSSIPSGAERKKASGQRAGRKENKLSKLAAYTSFFGTLGILYVGWLTRDYQYFVAEFGVGYWLGILGASLMALLLLYPLRKRNRYFRNLGPVRIWFRTHMIFGVLGPVLILFHCNFSLGSFNSRVALFCTLTVAISGLIGRYIYSRIHYGLYGSRASLDSLREDFGELAENQSIVSRFVPSLVDDLARVEAPLLHPRPTLGNAIWTALYAGVATHWYHLRTYFRINRAIREAAGASDVIADEQKRLTQNSHKYLALRLKTLRKFAQFRLFERLFSLWHIVHYPLFIVLVVAAIIHVIAVHMY